MSRIVVVHVDSEDIAAGERRSCKRCPVAQAMRRAGFEDPEVNGLTLSWFTGIGREYVETPDDVVAFATCFDDDDTDGVRPFAFEVDLDVTTLSWALEPPFGNVELP